MRNREADYTQATISQYVINAIFSSFPIDKPIIDRSPIISKSASDNGSTGKLYCQAEGAPNVTFSWSREGTVLLNSDNSENSAGKYFIEPTTQVDLITFRTVLLINEVSNTDYGAYTCIARNELGFDTVTINFDTTSKPDPPLAVRIINITSDSITLKWVSGFDGGLAQSFRVRFKAAGSDPYLYSDVHPTNTTQYAIKGLLANTEYMFNVMSYNELGESKFTEDIVKATTLKGIPPFQECS